MPDSTKINPFTLSGFDTPEDIYRKIMGQSMAGTSQQIAAASARRPLAAGGAASIGENFGIGFGNALGGAMTASVSPELKDAKARQKLLSGMNWDDPKDIAVRAKIATKAGDTKTAMFLSNRIVELRQNEAAKEYKNAMLDLKTQRLQMQADDLERKKQEFEKKFDLASASAAAKEKANASLDIYRNRMAKVAERNATTGEGRLAATQDMNSARKDLIAAQIDNLSSQMDYRLAQTNKLKAGDIKRPTTTEIKLVERRYKKGDLQPDTPWNHLNMSNDDVKNLSAQVAEQAYKVKALNPGMTFSEAVNQVDRELKDSGAFITVPGNLMIPQTSVDYNKVGGIPETPPAGPPLSPEDPASLGLTEEDITYNMKKYGKTREEVMNQARKMRNQ